MVKNWYKEYSKEISKSESAMIHSAKNTKGGFKTPQTERLNNIGHRDTIKALKRV